MQMIWIERIDRIDRNSDQEDIYKFNLTRKGATYASKSS